MRRGRLHSADAMLVTANVLWSLNYAITKLAFQRWQPLAFAGSRFLLAGTVAALVVRRREGGLGVARADWPAVLLAAACGILLNQVTFTYAVRETAAANVALILASSPMFAAVIATLAGHERVTGRHWAAIACSASGVALVIHGGSGLAGFSLLGDLLALGAALTWAIYAVVLRPLNDRYSAGRVSALMLVLGGAMLLPVAAPQMASQDYGSVGALRFGAWGYATVFPLLVTNILFFRSLRHVGASRATLYMYLQPFLGALFAAVLLGERLSPEQLAGGVVIVSGVAIGGRAGRRAEPAEPAPAYAGSSRSSQTASTRAQAATSSSATRSSGACAR